MDFKAKEFTELIQEVVANQVTPAHTRSLFPVQSEIDAVTSVDFMRHTGNSVTGDWNPVGSVNNFDGFSISLDKSSNPVIERRLAINMTHFDRMQAQKGLTLTFQDRVANMFKEVELEVDDITFNGKSGVKGVYDASYFVANRTVASPAVFANSSDAQLKDTILKAVKASKDDGKYQGSKTMLINSSAYNVLRSKSIGNTSITVLEWIKNNVGEIGQIKEVPGITNILIYENNPSYLAARFTFPLNQVGPTKEEGGSLTAFYLNAYAGVLVKNPNTLVRITGV